MTRSAVPIASAAQAAVDPREARAIMLREGVILPTLLRLSLPNLIALCSSAVVSIAETAYVGALGVASLGGIALAFPLFMLMQMLSAGAMGGTVSGAISRALGARDLDAARGLVLSSLLIAIVLGLALSTAVRLFGAAIYSALGGQDEVLSQALAFSNTAAWGIPGIWLANILASVLRGTGNMTTPAATLLLAGIGQALVGGTLGLGLGPFPRYGIAGVAAGQVVAFWVSALFLFSYLRSTRASVGLVFARGLLHAAHAKALMRVGSVAMLSPVFSVATILVLTRLVAEFGPQALAGYGIGVRLEFLLIPIAFSVGVASVPMVGTAIGASDVPRARSVAWTSGTIAFVAVGTIGLAAALAPWLWVDLFTETTAVREAAYGYLGIAGFAFGFFGVGLCLYFASQGAGKVGWVIVVQALRLAIVLAGGAVIVSFDQPLNAIFILSAVAMTVMGLGTATVVRMSNWG